MNNKFSWQSFISIGLLFSFIIMLFSGLILYVAPEGSLSRWIGWEVFHLSKKQWEHQHTIFSYLFILFSIFHIFKINWVLMLSYFIPQKIKIINYKELVITLLIVVFVFFGTLVKLNPFEYVLHLGNQISDSHIENVEMPQVADAEKLTLEEFADKIFEVSFSEIEKIFKVHHFIEVRKDITIAEFSSLNKITPEQLYKILKGELIKESSNGVIDMSSISSFATDYSTIL